MSWDDDSAWEVARGRTREQVRAAFAPRPTICRQCGHEAVTSARVCPSCGSAYAQTREPGMTRRTKRRLLFGSSALAAILVVLGLLIVPQVQQNSRDAEARAVAQSKRVLAATRRRIAFDQKLRAEPLTFAHLSQRTVIATLEAAVTRDAKRRVASGQLQGPILHTNCSPWAPAPRRGSTLSFSCTAANVLIKRGSGKVAGVLGYPFWAKADLAHRRLYWCKVNPKPGEQEATLGQLVVQLDPRCNLDQ